MNERGWFTLAVRILGLVLVGYGLASGCQGVAYAVYYFVVGDANQQSYQVWWYMSSGITTGLQIGFGLYFLFGATWLINALCKQVVDRCVLCGYNLAGTAKGAVCPECGRTERSNGGASPGEAS